MTEQDRAAVAALSALFREHVDVKQLLADLEGATARPSEWAADLAQYPMQVHCAPGTFTLL